MMQMWLVLSFSSEPVAIFASAHEALDVFLVCKVCEDNNNQVVCRLWIEKETPGKKGYNGKVDT
jgi:hypothetical protein